MSNGKKVAGTFACPCRIVTPFLPCFFEHNAWERGVSLCGIDEAGRGCLAGPVVAAAASLRPWASHPLLRDSKTLSPSQRGIMIRWLHQNAHWGIGMASASFINRYGIVAATQFAMRQAYWNLQATTRISFLHILVDAVPLHLEPRSDLHSCTGTPVNLSHQLVSGTIPTTFAFPHGEAHSSSISAASIIAKVTRDRILTNLHQLFPSYGFAQHKGYGTAQHYKALHQHGAASLHRTLFLRSLKAEAR